MCVAQIIGVIIITNLTNLIIILEYFQIKFSDMCPAFIQPLSIMHKLQSHIIIINTYINKFLTEHCEYKYLLTCNVLTITGTERGPSPAGLNAKICIRYCVYLSRNTRLYELYVAGTTSSSSSILSSGERSCASSVAKQNI